MLKGQLIHPQILEVLGRSGHGSKVLIADGNYPFATKLGPNATLVSLNLAPGLVSGCQALETLLSAMPVEAAAVMQYSTTGPYALTKAPPIWKDYTKLLKGGVRIYERRGALLHAKTAVIDGVWSCVGSSNLDWRSAVDNDEINAVVLSREFAEQMLAAFHRDLALSDETTLAHWRHRGFGERVKEQFFAMIGRLL